MNAFVIITKEGVYGFPAGVYRIVGQDKLVQLLTLERMGARKQMTTLVLRHLLETNRADLTQKPKTMKVIHETSNS